MPTQEELQDIVDKTLSRRRFAQGLFAGGVTLGTAGLLHSSASLAGAQSIDDVAILNFALNLEYLEAEFYTVVTTGQRLDQLGFEVGGVGTPGPTTGGGVVALSGILLEVARSLANEEQMHVKLLRSAWAAPP